MRATQDQQMITLISGERIAPGYRGRRHSPQITNKAGRRIAVVFAAALLGFATAAAAISFRNSNDVERWSAGVNLRGSVSGSAGFEAALY